MAHLESLMQEHFIDYASYFILDRAIPDILDGLKPVQRRILHTLRSMHDGRYHKVANVIGETMKLHPHGDASIGDALVVLANKDYFIDRQGNFGNIITGHSAAASRYIECRLTPLALATMFNENLTEFVESYDGRNKEPVSLPAKLPVVLMLGTEGIAVGMSTKILPHNLPELWEAQIALLNGERVDLHPDFQQGGLMDVSAYDEGRGKVEVRARIKTVDPKTVVITEIPYGTTTEGLIASIEAAAQKERVKISSINDFTTGKVEIELTLSRGARPKDVIPQLYAYTDCSVSISSNINVIRDRRPVQVTVIEILEFLTGRLREQIKAELEWERGQLVDRQHWLTLEQIFVEKRVYKRIEDKKTQEAVHKAVVRGMEEYEDLFVRPMVDEDVKRLLDVRIRRISAYDIEKNRDEIEEVIARIAQIDQELEHLTRTTIHYIEGLLEKFGDQYPRHTHITSITTVDKKSVANQNIKLSYDKDSGFFGTEVRGEQFKMTVSEYDLVLAISSDGSYRIIPPVDKIYFSGKLVYCERFDPEAGIELIAVYRDADGIAFGKRFEIKKFVRSREYQLIKDKRGSLDLLLPPEHPGTVALKFKPAPRQRVKNASFDLETLDRVGAGARGSRLAPKPVAKVDYKPPKARKKAARKRKAAASKKAPGTRTSGGGDQGDLF